MDSAASILSDLDPILDRIAKLDHPDSEKALLAIQAGADWIREAAE